MLVTGERLRAERERLNLSQEALANHAGCSLRSQRNYEQGERSPDAKYLGAVARAGVDVQYVVTGVPSPSALSTDEREMLSLFRPAPLTLKAAAVGALRGGVQAAGLHMQHTGDGGLQVAHVSGTVTVKGKR